jgi:hypothetical protein
VRDPRGALERVQITWQNLPGHVITNGIDFGGTVTLTGATFGGGANDFGAFILGAQGTLTLNYYYPRAQAALRTVPNSSPRRQLPPLHCDESQCNAVGSRNYNTFAPPLPRWRVNIPLSWAMKGHAVSVIGHYLSGIENDNAVGQDGSLAMLNAIFTFDVQYAYSIRDWFGKELSFRIGLYNVFDTLPPATRDNNGFEALLYDPRGRMVYAKLISTF